MKEYKRSSLVILICVIVLSSSHAFFYSQAADLVPHKNVAFNGIRILIFCVFGTVMAETLRRRYILLIALLLFFYEHVLLKYLHFRVMGNTSSFWENFEVVGYSFLTFLPVILMLTLLGVEAKANTRSIEK